MNDDRPGDEVLYQRYVKVVPQLSAVLGPPDQALELPIARCKELGIQRAEHFRVFVQLADDL